MRHYIISAAVAAALAAACIQQALAEGHPVISTAGNYCFAIKSDGTLWEWTYNGKDPLSPNDILLTEPKKIADDVLSTHGASYINEKGELYHLDDTNDDWVSVLDSEDAMAVGNSQIGYVVKNDSTLWMLSTEDSPMKKIMRNTEDIADGHYHTIVLRTDGTVMELPDWWCTWSGANVRGFYKVDGLDNVRHISAGNEISFAVTEDNVAWRWGTNYGQYCVEDDHFAAQPERFTDNVKQIMPKQGWNLVLKLNGELWAYGLTETDESTYAESATDSVYWPTLAELDELPRKIMDNIVEISEDMNGTVCGPALALTESGELILIDLFENNGKAELRTYAIAEDIKLPEPEEPETPTTREFSDIPAGGAVYDAAVHLAKAGILTGAEETKFMPDKPMTRVETAAALLRMLGKAEMTGTASFTDVDRDDWYYDTLRQAKAVG